MQSDDSNRTCAIYGLRRSDIPDIRYIGQTTRRVDERLEQHLSQARNGRKSPLSAWIRKALSDEATVRPVVLEGAAIWNVAEREWIAKFRSDGARLLNLTSGGQGSARQGEKNTQSKLTESEVHEIRSSRLSNRSLAKVFGVSEGAICVVRLGISWSHVAGTDARKLHGAPLRKFFDGEEPLPIAFEVARRYRAGETMEVLAAEFHTTRPTMLRMFRVIGVKTRDGGAEKRPLIVNGNRYPGVLAAMREERMSHAKLMKNATFL